MLVYHLDKLLEQAGPWACIFIQCAYSKVFDLLNVDVASFLPGEDDLKLGADVWRLKRGRRSASVQGTLQAHIAVSQSDCQGPRCPRQQGLDYVVRSLGG